jgi:PST family polysaccharide transporter
MTKADPSPPTIGYAIDPNCPTMDELRETVSSPGLARVTISGTAWAAGQTALNKIGTIAAIWVISRQVTQDEFGMAAVALTVVKFLAVFPPLNMADVLMVLGPRSPQASRLARSWVLKVGIATTLLLLMASPLVSAFYSNYPQVSFTGLFLIASLRPAAEAMQVGNLTRLRLAFRNRTIALIDGSVQLTCTLLSVAMAFMGFGAWVVVIPSVAVVFGKAASYNEACRGSSSSEEHLPELNERAFKGSASRDVKQQFLAASGGQYVHSIADSLPVLILGKLASDTETGIYAFALSLSSQANALVATQIAGVLQPVLGRLTDDPRRQADAYLRTMRLISAIAVPLCVVQAVFSEAIFSWVFQQRWQSASNVFAVLSICEAFFFASAPTMAMLKAQGRFRTFLAWQSAQLFGSTLLLPIAALNGGALSVAICATCLWAVGLPIAVWLSVRDSGHSIWHALRLFAIPWLTALPIGLASWHIESQLLALGSGGAMLATLVAAPITLLIMIAATRWTQPSVFREILSITELAIQRVPLIRRLLSTSSKSYPP